MLRGARGALALAAASAAISPAACDASAGISRSFDGPIALGAAAALPPDLQALEQKALALQITSVRFSVSESIGGAGAVSGLFGNLEKKRPSRKHEASGLATIVEVTGEESFAPIEASFQSSFLGLKGAGRLIGTTLYLEEPFIASLDGGRPWVEEQDQDLEQATGIAVTTLGGQPGSGADRLFGAEIEAVNRARSIEEIGTSTVDDQPVTTFDASIELAALAKGTAAQQRALRKLIRPLAEVELSIAEDGLPVRTLITLRFRGHKAGELVVGSNILAINIPIVPVQAPPPAKTITEAQLKRLLAPKRTKMRRSGRRRRTVVKK